MFLTEMDNEDTDDEVEKEEKEIDECIETEIS